MELMEAPAAPPALSVPPARSTPPGERDGLGKLETDVAHSVRNAAKLGASLLGTWAVALVVRVFLPRHLGPEAFGTFQFTDAFTTTIFVVTTLGVETYVRKEVATRPEHANEFFGGTLLVRLALGALVMLLALPALAAAGKPALTLRLVMLLGAAQVLVYLNLTFAALLQSVGAVGGLSLLNVGAKVVWGAGILVAFALGGGVQSVALAMLLSEVLRTACLAALARRHAGLRFAIDVRAAGGVLLASLPFYLGDLAQTVYQRIDVSIMSFLASDVEVGWYGAAANLAGLSMLLSPLIGWVLLPLTSRAAARSEEELTRVFRRSMELTLAVAFPVTLFLGVGADVIVGTVFGPAYEPAGASLRLLAPTFVLTYIAMIDASILVRLGRGWALTLISLSSMLLSPLLNLWLIPHALAAFGPGGAGRGAAIAQIITEAYTVAVMTWLLGRRVFDRRSLTMIAKTGAVCAAVVAAHCLLAPLNAWRLVVDGVLYVVLAVACGAVDVRGWTAVARGAFGRRATPRAA